MILQVRRRGERRAIFTYLRYPSATGQDRTGSSLVEAETHVMSCWPTVFWVPRYSYGELVGSCTVPFCGMGWAG